MSFLTLHNVFNGPASLHLYEYLQFLAFFSKLPMLANVIFDSQLIISSFVRFIKSADRSYSDITKDYSWLEVFALSLLNSFEAKNRYTFEYQGCPLSISLAAEAATA